MKTLSVCFVLILLVIPRPGISSDASANSGRITLTATQVTSAIDIENAIHQITREGTRPGVIILDGREGPFIYTGIDRSINIFYSNLTLRGVNNASFPNSTGIYIDNVPADNLVFENLYMICTGDCLGMVGTHNRVTVRHNLFKTGGMGVGVNGGRDWLITDNTITAPAFALYLIRTQNAVVTHNHLCGQLGIVVEGARFSTIRDNAISSGCQVEGQTWQGVLLKSEAFSNLIVDNTIIGVQQSGISLEAGVSDNTIRGNDVLCAVDAPCLTVNAPSPEMESNTIQANRP